MFWEYAAWSDKAQAHSPKSYPDLFGFLFNSAEIKWQVQGAE